MPMDVFVFHAGLLAVLAGLVCLVRPIALIGIRSRAAGAALAAAGVLLALAGAYVIGGRAVHAAEKSMKLDDFMPVYHFHEVHEVRVHAPAARAYQAVRAVTPQEIRFLKTLLGLRTLPSRLLARTRVDSLLPGYRLRSHDQEEGVAQAFVTGPGPSANTVVNGARTTLTYERQGGRAATPAEILDKYVAAIQRRGALLVSRGDRSATLRQTGQARAWISVEAEPGGDRYRLVVVQPSESTRPILDQFTASGFLLLAETSDREVVIGTVNRAWQLSGEEGAPAIGSPARFVSFGEAGYVKITCNFYVQDEKDGWSSVRTETRVLATDDSAWRRFAPYWRLIYPGSALIRREMLHAIKRRAETPALAALAR
jgi:hypothetical protein